MPIGTIIWRTLLAAFLLSLFFIAFNFFGWMFWVGGFFILLTALSHLVGELRRARRVPLLVISLATVALFFGACANHVRAFGQHSKQTRAFAEEMHAQCNREGACPSEEKACTPGVSVCRTAGSLGVQLAMRYRVADDTRSFTVTTHIGDDDATIYEGGVGRALTRRDTMDGQDIHGENTPPRVLVPYDAGVTIAAAVVDAGVP